MFLIFSLLIILTVSQDSSWEKVKEYYNNLTITKQQAQDLLNNFKQYIDFDVYKDIYKNPPKDQGVTYDTIDFDSELDKVQKIVDGISDTINKYEFSINFINLTERARDGHFNYIMKSSTKYYAVLQHKFKLISKDNVISLKYDNVNVDKVIVNGQKFNNVEYNTSQTITAFKLIQDLGDYYSYSYNNPHSRFNSFLFYAKKNINSNYVDFSKDPVSLSITLSNGTTFKLSETFVGVSSFETSNHDAPLDWKDSKEQISRMSRGRRDDNESPFKYLENDKSETAICFVYDDGTTKYNSFIMTSFYPALQGGDEIGEFVNFSVKCISEFNKNDYDVVIHMHANGGGYVVLADIMRYLFFPKMDLTTLPGTLRQSEISDYLYKEIGILDVYSCKVKDLTKINIKNMYGEGNDHNIYDISYIENPQDYLDNQETLKRNKEQVVILTDATCFSACSMFTKPLIENNLALVYTYGGNKFNEGVKMEASLNPTSVFDMTYFDDESVNYSKVIKNIDYVRVPWFETFELHEAFRTEKYEELKVEQFVVTEPYGNIDEFYPTNFQDVSEFVELHQLALKKMKNVFPKSIVDVDYNKTCDASIDDMVMGKDGNDKCVNLYCANGKGYNQFKNKCVDYECALKLDGSFKTFIYLFVLICFILF